MSTATLPQRPRSATPAFSTMRLQSRIHTIALFATRLLLVAIVTIAPWWFGGVGAKVQFAACCAVAAALACWMTAHATKRRNVVAVPVASIPLLLAILFGLLQTVPLPFAWLECISPTAAEHWRPVVAEAGTNLPEGTRAGLSLYPASTRWDVSQLCLAAAVFFLGAHVYSGRNSQRWLWTGIAVCGAVMAVFGIVQHLTWNGRLFWSVEPTQVSTPFGPYVNHNNAAGYLNMCLAGALAWLLYRPSQTRHTNDEDDSETKSARRSCGLRWQTWMPVVLAGAIVAGICCSLSRGGFVSMAAGLVVVLAASRMVDKSWKQAARIGGAAFVAIVLLSALGLSNGVEQRLASLFNQTAAPDERLIHWKDSLQAVPDFWATGSGLGTYRYLYRYYESRPGQEWFYHAENQYIEALVEAGLPGLVLLLLAAALVAAAALHVARNDASRLGRAMALAALFALTTQLVHAVFDFGLYLPANMLLLALISGAVVGRAGRWPSSRWRLAAALPLHSKPAGALVVGTLMVACLLPLQETSTMAALDESRQDWNALNETSTLQARELALAKLQRAAFDCWDDADAQLSLAQCSTNVYRQRVLHRLRQQHPDQSEEALWRMTSIAELRKAVHALIAAGDSRSLTALRRDPAINDTLAPAFGHWKLARRASPLMPQTRLQLAELSPLFEAPDAQARYLDGIERIVRSQPELVYRAGLLHFEAGRTESALDLWRVLLTHCPEYEGDVSRYTRQSEVQR